MRERRADRGVAASFAALVSDDRRSINLLGGESISA
jgi:hypothetical protein